jgi:hypothetical protein
MPVKISSEADEGPIVATIFVFLKQVESVMLSPFWWPPAWAGFGFYATWLV